jgi:hypothetical protein
LYSGDFIMALRCCAGEGPDGALTAAAGADVEASGCRSLPSSLLIAPGASEHPTGA